MAVHLADIQDFQAFSDTFARIFHWKPKPTRIINQAGALWPGLRIEVERTAYKPRP